MPAADPQGLEEHDGMFNPLCTNLHLLADFQFVAQLLTGRLRNEDLAAGGAGLDPRGEVDMASDHAVLHPFRRADIANHHLTGMEPYTHLHLR